MNEIKKAWKKKKERKKENERRKKSMRRKGIPLKENDFLKTKNGRIENRNKYKPFSSKRALKENW